MVTGFVYSELYLWHDTGSSPLGYVPAGLEVEPHVHPESAEAKRRFRNLLDVSGLLDKMMMLKPKPATEEQILRYHTREYLERIKALSADRGGDAGELTPFGPGSYEIALRAAGGVIGAIEAVLAGEVDNVYALVRPPGHHAEADRGRGFCIFDNVAIAIMHARAGLRIGRVAVVDWDVHHGNGTQKAFYSSSDVLTISIHQDRLYPTESGALDETGSGAGLGYNLNIPLPPGSGVGAYEAAFERVVVPALNRFRPELIVVSSGFDGCAFDPLARMMVDSECYRQMARMVKEVASAHCGGRLVCAHEGGYSAAYTPYCGLAVMEELSGIRTQISDPFLPALQRWGHRTLQPHQDEAVERAAANVERIRAPDTMAPASVGNR
jgi:acetoin utilization deacetylase AcuC-like enzyme